jgi:hypothetical protein
MGMAFFLLVIAFAIMESRTKPYYFLLNVLTAAMLLIAYGSSRLAFAHQPPPYNLLPQKRGEPPARMGCLYVFRAVRSYGAHIDDFVTIDGRRVHRITPGTAFHCELRPGNYVVGVARHKTRLLKVSIGPSQCRYVSVTLHAQAGVAPRSGVLTSDQSFDVRLVEPGYGAERVREYRLTEGKCQP